MSIGPYYLSPQLLQKQLSFPQYINTVQINNPTASAILFRRAGTDFPTRNSADLIIPAQTLMQIPGGCKDFAFSFDNPASLGVNNPLTTVTLDFFLPGEPIGQIGSIQAIARPNWYDRFPLTVIAGFNGAVPPHALTARWGYIPPPQRIGIVESLELKITRENAATVAGTAEALIQYQAPGGALTPILVALIETNAIGDHDTVNIPTQMFVDPAGQIKAYTLDTSTGGSVRFDVMLKATEIDA